MTAFAPHGYVGYPAIQFGSPNRIDHRNYHDRYRRRNAFYAPQYPPRPLYQPPQYSFQGYSAPGFDRYAFSGIGNQLIDVFKRLDSQYRREQYMNRINKAQNNFWKKQSDYLSSTTQPTDWFYHSPTVYQYEKEIQYLPYPILINRGGGTNYGMGGGMNLLPKVRVIFMPTGQSSFQQPYIGPLGMPPFLFNRISQPFYSFALPPPLPQLGSMSLTPAVQQMVMQRYSNPVAVLPFNSSWQMPPMMMPAYSQQQSMVSMSAFQQFQPAPQSFMPLSMPLCPSLPPAPQAYIPPPDPIAAMPIVPSFPPAPPTYIPYPAPVATMPIIPSFPPVPQTYIPPPAPVATMPIVPSFLPAPQTYIPPPAPVPTMPAVSSFLSTSQSYVPSSSPSVCVSMVPSVPPPPESYIPPPTGPPVSMPVISSLPLPPQSYVPSPVTMSPSPPMLPQLSPELQLLNASSAPSLPQYSNSTYGNICRACPPPPPPLTVAVSGYCWLQHCPACHHVPMPISQPNDRPTGGRITPLLRYPTVPQYVPDQTTQQQKYFHADAPVIMRPWLRKTPPLPPGSFLISDEYINKHNWNSQYIHSERKHKYDRHNSRSKHRSLTVAPKTTSMVNPPLTKNNNRGISPTNRTAFIDYSTQNQHFFKSKDAVSITSSDVSSTTNSSYEKQIITTKPPSKIQQTMVPQQLTNEARRVNLQYSYQAEKIPTVYLINRYLKSSSESSTLISTHRTSSDCSPSSNKEHNQIESPSIDVDSLKEETKSEKNDEKSTRPPSQPTKPKEKLIIIREFITNSPSTISTISSNMTFSIVERNSEFI